MSVSSWIEALRNYGGRVKEFLNEGGRIGREDTQFSRMVEDYARAGISPMFAAGKQGFQANASAGEGLSRALAVAELAAKAASTTQTRVGTLVNLVSAVKSLGTMRADIAKTKAESEVAVETKEFRISKEESESIKKSWEAVATADEAALFDGWFKKEMERWKASGETYLFNPYELETRLKQAMLRENEFNIDYFLERKIPTTGLGALERAGGVWGTMINKLYEDIMRGLK